ncbi:MAG TPA: hypothetical protein VGF82_22300 [Terracidiphilus sp.]|jgi:hypothetical protein
MIRSLTALVVLLALLSESAPTAREQLAELRRRAHAARQSGDNAGYLQSALKVQTLLNDAPDAIESAAFAYTLAGDTQHALDALARFADMGQVDDSLSDGSSKLFAPLAASPRYKVILDRFASNKVPVSTAKPAFTVPDAGIVAEDIDYDPHSKTFLITSILEHKVLRLTASGAASDFAQSPSHWPMLAIKVDRSRNLLWATEVALDGFTPAPKSDWGSSALLCFELSTGKLLRRIEGPPHSALGDMVLAQNGDPILSDGKGGGIYRLLNNDLRLINGQDFISPQTPALLPDGEHILVPDYLRGIGKLDLRTGSVEWLGQAPPRNIAVNGIDGLYFDRGTLLLTQNGTSPERVIQIKLDPSLTQMTSSSIIERATATLGDPTHGVVVGNSFFYIANSGWSELDDHGDLKPGSRLTSPQIMQFKLH